jgi:histidinol-phosphate aminotransferase
MNLRKNPNLERVPLYIAGKPIDEVKEEYGLTEVVKLASNENPLGPSPKALVAYHEALVNAHRYPGVGELRLRQKLAEYSSVGDGSFPFTEHNFLTGNGLSDVLRIIVESFVFDGGEAIICMPTFPLYKILVQQYGGTCVFVPHKDFYYDLQAMADAITPDTRVIFVCNPNNPTGTLVSRAEVDAFMERVPRSVIVVFDESYAELVEVPYYSDAADFISRGRDEVILLRGFSKVFGLANLRIGYAIGTHAMIEYLRHAQIVFNTGDPVFYAAMAALDDREHIENVRTLIHTEKQFLYDSFTKLNLPFVPTHANFILLPHLPMPANDISEGLLRRGIIVRVTGGFGLPDAIRVTIGSHWENEKFVAALREVLKRGNVDHGN